MSDNLNDVLSGRAFKTVEPQRSDDGEQQAEKLNLQIGDQFVGTLTEVFEFASKYKKGVQVKGYNLAALNGDPKVLIQKGNLAWHMGPVKVGQLVRITRFDDDDIKSAEGADMKSSSWGVEVAE
jgi:hypothetical protein